ncbi:Cytochrome P450 71A1 [Cinnamomum micranthum f. kanehirae]|uniref:Cytochrome P450 71A1 n=1 Tax=Cinnamomum micranthum f. kanehirae TaxID=337451 RepID=A0A443NYY9_9MAGN|nr:Cytochrome P450 71A1 [Cinnamomum micranthum f. kanehirae]
MSLAMDTTTALVFLSSACALFTFFFFLGGETAKKKSVNLPPTPPKLPIIGNFHQFSFLLHHALRLLSNKHGPLMLLYQCHIPTLIVSSQETAEEVMKTHDLVFANRPHNYAAKHLLYDGKDILFSSYGQYWREARKICMLQLLSLKRISSFQPIIEEEIAATIKLISRSCPTSSVIDLRLVLQLLFSGIISRVALGKKYGGIKEFLEALKEMGELLGAVRVGDYFPSFAWVDVLTGFDGKMKRVSRNMDTFLDRVVKDREEMDGRDGNQHKDFVDTLRQLEKDSGQLTRDSIKAIVLDMFAGSEFITMTTEWAMAELMKHPDIMVKAQEEVRRLVGRKPKVEVEDIHQMHYLKCIIKETLRLHPPGPLLGPRESNDNTTIQGYHIPQNTRVIINAWAISRDPKSWKCPEEFLPERFANNSIDFKGHDFQFIPFGAGRRMCPGASFAIHIIEFVLTDLLRYFDWELPNGATAEDLEMAEEGGIISPKEISLHLVPICHFPLCD